MFLQAHLAEAIIHLGAGLQKSYCLLKYKVMFEGEKQIERTSPLKTHELRVAVFDLSQRALIGYADGLSLIRDEQPLNEQGFPGIAAEKRATNIGTRQALQLPPMRVLGRLSGAEKGIDAYAVSTYRKIELIDSSLEQYDIKTVRELVEDALENPENSPIDQSDARILASSFRLPEVHHLLG